MLQKTWPPPPKEEKRDSRRRQKEEKKDMSSSNSSCVCVCDSFRPAVVPDRHRETLDSEHIHSWEWVATWTQQSWRDSWGVHAVRYLWIGKTKGVDKTQAGNGIRTHNSPVHKFSPKEFATAASVIMSLRPRERRPRQGRGSSHIVAIDEDDCLIDWSGFRGGPHRLSDEEYGHPASIGYLSLLSFRRDGRWRPLWKVVLRGNQVTWEL